jgi:hypothetical protein
VANFSRYFVIYEGGHLVIEISGLPVAVGIGGSVGDAVQDDPHASANQ